MKLRWRRVKSNTSLVGPDPQDPDLVKSTRVLTYRTRYSLTPRWVCCTRTHGAARRQERRRWRGEEEDGAEEARDPDASSAGHEQTDRHFPFSEVGLGHSDPAMNYEVVSPGGPAPGQAAPSGSDVTQPTRS